MIRVVLAVFLALAIGCSGGGSGSGSDGGSGNSDAWQAELWFHMCSPWWENMAHFAP